MKFKIATEEDQELGYKYNKRISQEEFKGYVFTIIGGCDKQGFPMKQGVQTSRRVCLLLHRDTPCFRGYGRRTKTCLGGNKK